MRFIANVVDRRRVWKALLDYPVYSPPFRDSEAVLAPKEIKANFDYFLGQKSARLECLANYLGRFSIELGPTSETISALDNWLYRYGGHLIYGGSETLFALHDYVPVWDRDYHGLNIMNDISIFLGECIMSSHKNAWWDVWYGDGTRRAYERQGFGHPCIFGLPHFDLQNPYWILGLVKDCCMAANSRLSSSRARIVLVPWDVPGELVRKMGYLANTKPPVGGLSAWPDPAPPVPAAGG